MIVGNFIMFKGDIIMKKLFRCILAAAGIFFLATGCQNATNPSSDRAAADANGSNGITGIVSGVVLEKGALVFTPVAGAVVSMGGYAPVTTDANGVWVIKGVIPNYSSSAGAALGSGYTAVVKKDNYAPATVNGIWVNAHEYVDDDPYNEAAVSKALIEVLKEYSDQLDNLQTLTIASSGTTTSEDGAAPVSLTDLSSSISSLATGMSKIAYSYSVSASVAKLAPLTCSVKGTFKLCPVTFETSAGKAVVSAPAGMTVQIRGYMGGAADENLYGTTTTDANGTFSVENLPAATTLVIVVPGFNYEIGGKTRYFSTAKAAWLGEDNPSLSNLIISAQTTKTPLETGSAILYAQPAKIIITGNNAGPETINSPLPLTSSLTFTFDRAMSGLLPVFYSSDNLIDANKVAETVTVTWDPGKTTATIAPADGKFDSAIKYIVLTGEALDGCTTFEQPVYEVHFDSIIKVSATNTGDATIAEPLSVKTPLTFTFDRAMASLAPEFYTSGNISSVNRISADTAVTWDAERKTATITAANGKFNSAIKAIVLNGEALDGSTEFEQTVYNVNFLSFAVQSVNVIDSTDVPADVSSVARSAVAVTSSQYLALTFNDTIASATVYMGTADTYSGRSLVSVKSKDTVLYIPFGDAVNTASADLKVWGTVESSRGDESTCAFGSSSWKLDAYFAYPEYRISSSNLYTVTSAINDTDDSVTSTIAPGTAITLTFDKAFATGSSVKAELYKAGDSVITENALPVAASVSGSTVTITPSADLAAGTYHMSLEIISGATTEFTTVNKAFGSEGYEKFIYNSVQPGYITFFVSNPMIKTGSNYATTAKIAGNEAVVLEFDQPVTGYSAILTTSSGVSAGTVYAEEVKALKSAGTYIPAVCTVASKKMTIAPESNLGSSSSLYVYVYDTDGSLLTGVYNGNIYFKVTVKTGLVDVTVNTAGTLSLMNDTAKIDSSTALKFSFVPFALEESGSSTTYYVMKNTYNAEGVLSGWKNTGVSVSVSPLEYVRNEAVSVVVPQSAADYNYGNHTVSYVLVAAANNLVYYSTSVAVSDVVHPVFLCSSAGVSPDSTGGSYDLSTANASSTITFTVTNVTGESIQKMDISRTFTDNTITVEGKYNAAGTGVDVTITRNGGTFASGDSVTVGFTDMSGNDAQISATNTAIVYNFKIQ